MSRSGQRLSAGDEVHVPKVTGMRSVLFVCLGNICRSPTAQGIFEHLAIRRGVRDQLLVESCGTGNWHVGELPDERTRKVSKNRGVELVSKARVVDPTSDFEKFELIVPMDHRNRRHLMGLGCPEGKMALLRVFDPSRDHSDSLEVPDPYDDDLQAFERVFDMIHAAAAGLLEKMFEQCGD